MKMKSRNVSMSKSKSMSRKDSVPTLTHTPTLTRILNLHPTLTRSLTKRSTNRAASAREVNAVRYSPPSTSTL